MYFGIEILAAVFFSISVYAFLRMVCILFARHELDVSSCNRKKDAIEVFADADSLEYYVRLALFVAEGRIEVIAYLKKENPQKAEMLNTISCFHRTHKNLSYRWI